MEPTESSDSVTPPSPGSDRGSAGRRSRVMRRVGLVLGVLVAVILAVTLVFVVRFRSLLDPETLADQLEPRISQAVNRPVSIEGASLRLWPRPAVRVEGIRVGNRGMFSETALATANAVLLEPRLLPLLRRQVVIDRIVVRSPRVLLMVAEDGTTNFGDFVPEPEEEGGAGRRSGLPGLSLEVRRVELADGRAGFRDAMRSRSLQLDGVNLRTDLDVGGAGSIGTEGSASAEKVTLRLPEAPGHSIERGATSLDWSGRVTSDFDAFELTRGILETGPFEARLSGRVTSLGSPVRILDLALRAEGLSLEDLVGQTDSGLQPAGSFAMDIRLQGAAGPGQSPDVSGLVTIRDGSVRTADQVLVLSGLDIDAEIEQGEAAVNARGRLLDGTMTASGTVALDSLLPFDFHVQAAAGLDRVLAAASEKDSRRTGSLTSIRGGLAVDARVAGFAGGSREPRIEGTATVSDLEAQLERLRSPIRASEIPIRLEGNTASWSGVRFEIGESTGSTTGLLRDFRGPRDTRTANPTVDAGFRFARLDLDAVLPVRAESPSGWGRLALARLGNLRIGGSTAEELAATRGQRRITELPVTGLLRFTIDTLLYGAAEFDDVQGIARLDRQRVEVPEIAFGAYGGQGTATASLELGSGFVEPFGLLLQLRDVRAERWLSRQTPLGEALRGTMDLDLELAGGLDTLLLPTNNSLTGSGTVQIRDGSIQPNPVTTALAAALGAVDPTGGRLESWVSRFRIDDGAVHLSDGRVEFDRGEVDLGGSVAFDGALNLGLTYKPSPEQVRTLSDKLLAGVPESTRGLLSQGGPVELGVRVGGHLTSPAVSLDPTSINVGAASAVDAGRSEIERRGLDLLRRLTESPADTAAGVRPGAPSDTAGNEPEGGPR